MQPGDPIGNSCPPIDPRDISRREFLKASSCVAATVALGTLPQTATAQAGGEVTSANIQFTVNGVEQRLTIDPRSSLLDVLRDRLDLTGTKKGCNQGACGACTVLVNGRRVLSCLTLAAMQQGGRITTIEGLARDGELHPLQTAFIEHEGFQCGYCTSGQIMSGVACIAEGHASSPDEIRFWMSGNICRCGAYPGIVAAVAAAAGEN
jgi:xanthine dehydrogenase YagT iron-sulfur-binding subunit